MRWPEWGPEPVAEVSAGANSAERAQSDRANEVEEPAARLWPRPVQDLGAPQRLLDEELKRDETLGWEA
jgi:hypothetical protein